MVFLIDIIHFVEENYTGTAGWILCAIHSSAVIS